MGRLACEDRVTALSGALILSLLFFASAAPAQVMSCVAGSPPGEQVSESLFTSLRPTLNHAWDSAKTRIDPIDPTDSDPFGTGTQTVGCTSDAGLYCATKGYTECDKITVYLKGYDYKGLSNVALQYNSLSQTTSTPKSVAQHSNRGPDAGKITDGVFAKDGTGWDDTTYATLIPFTGPAYGLVVDLGSVVNSICGSAANCKAPLFQGDKNAYLLEYSADGVNWQCYGQFPAGSSTGLRTRAATPLSAVQGCPATLPQTFSARYVSVAAYSGDGNYSASELQLQDTGGHVISRGKLAAGPAPAQITNGAPPPDGAAWDDKRAVVLATVGPVHGVVVDLLNTLHLCGGSCGPSVQADKNTYQLDYSTDGRNWTTYGTVPAVSPTGLQTRAIAPVDPPTANPDFDARYVRVSAVTGDGNYSVSQITLKDTTGAIVSVGKPTSGPEPFATNAEYAKEGATWNDDRYATVLRSCSTGNANSTCPSSTGGLPGLTAPLIVDLGSSFPISQLKLQADRHQFEVDISDDLVNWKPLAAFPAVSGDGLTTRVASASGNTGRYVRVYGTAGDDGNYSVSELDVITPVANTPCAYTPQYDANAGQNLSCSYDGAFEYQLTLPDATPVSYTVDSGSVRIYCSDVLGFSDSFTYESAPKGTACTANLKIKSDAVGGNYCAGTCGGAGKAALTYAQFGAANPDFTASNVSCPGMDSDFVELAGPLFEGVAAQAVTEVMNGVLAPPPGIMPYPASCAVSTSNPAPISQSVFKGTATGVGTGRHDASVQISGRFFAEHPIELDRSSFTLNELLDEVGKAGELVGDALGSRFGPLTLQPREGSSARAALFETPAGSKPRLRMELRAKNVNKGTIDFVLNVDDATIPAGPAHCSGRPHPTAKLTTAFLISGPGGQGASVRATLDWRCNGTKLRSN